MASKFPFKKYIQWIKQKHREEVGRLPPEHDVSGYVFGFECNIEESALFKTKSRREAEIFIFGYLYAHGLLTYYQEDAYPNDLVINSFDLSVLDRCRISEK